MFKEEIHLVNKFCKNISKKRQPLKLKKTNTEFGHPSGRVDIIGLSPNNEIIAIEAKLKNWKIALHQAYKNTSFAHYSYVLLPPESLKSAIKNQQEFNIRNVGLFTLNNDNIEIIFQANKNSPFLVKITKKAVDLLDK
ncbi:MAG TPA: hypothetical protein PLZ15_09245 [Melioribacteraceae bacterium]|nr:hypothetical protein [Melioribacteraceae bacterium]